LLGPASELQIEMDKGKNIQQSYRQSQKKLNNIAKIKKRDLDQLERLELDLANFSTLDKSLIAKDKMYRSEEELRETISEAKTKLLQTEKEQEHQAKERDELAAHWKGPRMSSRK